MKSAGPLMIFVGVLLLAFAAGSLVEKWLRKPQPEHARVRIDAKPGVEWEVIPAHGDEMTVIVCRLDDGKHNIRENG